jgi:6-pyruvoyltetrahydropterin/6-carboxytetrahydropterin synthase
MLMFAIEVSSTFSAAHALRLPNGKSEPLHGHDFRVTVKVACDILDELETVADFHDIEAALNTLLDYWRNQNLNKTEPFKTRVNPSAEQIAGYIGHVMSQGIHSLDPEGERKLRLVEVRVTEATNCLAIWAPT